MDPAFLEAVARVGTPLLLAALGELILERSGVLNIGIEGVLLSGAFFGFLAAWATGSPAAGALAALLAGALLAAALAFMVLRLKADSIVVGMALNLVAFGITGIGYVILDAQTKAHGGVKLVRAPTFGAMLPELAGVPILGPLFFDQSALTWLAFALVPLLWYYLERSERGLELRAVGEHPAAAESSGIDVTWCRFKACLAAGALGGLAGGFLTISQTSAFTPKCTAGRGFVALAAVVLGRYGAWGTAAACLFFGAAFSARDYLQVKGLQVPYELLEILPYALTVAALGLSHLRRTGAPAALGKPYG
ncbi:MAG: ABC transporter permease [Planctomycetota bacterium]|nr:ABC transporter permease [Planctomycetota bacterium]